MRLQLDEAADRGCIAFADRDAYAIGRARDTRRVEALDAHDNTVAIFTFLADFDEPRERDAGYRMLQNGMCDTCCLQCSNGKTAGARG
jgi:hypothetical protein